MLTFLVAIGSFIGFIVAYHTYGRWLARMFFNSTPRRKFPAGNCATSGLCADAKRGDLRASLYQHRGNWADRRSGNRGILGLAASVAVGAPRVDLHRRRARFRRAGRKLFATGVKPWANRRPDDCAASQDVVFADTVFCADRRAGNFWARHCPTV